MAALATAPTRSSLRASDPAVSAFVAASAGSGKTKLLTDRLLRLMLAGAEPERIQCLTFTKAAAAEMAVRLQTHAGPLGHARRRRAGRGELRALDVDADRRQPGRRARALFATVLDLPGGMRIGTIHAFCQSLLRRFPLEAALSPHFRLVDDRDAEDALTEARENMLAHASAPTHARRAGDARRASPRPTSSAGHVAALQADLPRLQRRARRWATGSTRRSAARWASPPRPRPRSSPAAIDWQRSATLREAALIVQRTGRRRCARTSRPRSSTGSAWTRRTAREHWPHWCDEFLTKEGKPRAPSGFVSKAVTDAHPDLADVFLAEVRPHPRRRSMPAWRCAWPRYPPRC